MIKKILLLGDPGLYKNCDPLIKEELDFIKSTAADLHDTMMDFREKYKKGRAIAAPQIGVFKRLIYMNVDKPVIIINPVLSEQSKEMIELWDNCMSFPDLLVKVRRHLSCRITYKDEEWNDQSMIMTGDLSELLQHEFDHLNGILAVSRAIDGQSFALTSP